MVIEKEWYKLTELAEKWDCTVDDILYLGVSGKLKLCFDWVSLRCEASDYNFFIGDDEHIIHFDELTKEIDALTYSYHPDYHEEPILRLAYLSTNDIGLIVKNGKSVVISGHLANDKYFLAQPAQDVKNAKEPFIEVKDIVVKATDIEQFTKQPHQNENIEQNIQPNANSLKEKANLYKTIGLLAKALQASGNNSMSIGDKPNVAAMARKLERYIPCDPLGQKEVHGLSDRALRERITIGLNSLDSN